jgi:enoyl-CoA hydratase/carnithine racemase
MDKVLFTVKNRSAWIVLNRPEKLNSLDKESWILIQEYIKKANDNPNVKLIVLTGSGDVFCAGEDLNDILSSSTINESLNLFYKYVLETFELIIKSSKPVLTVVNGPAYGVGVELVLASDLAIAVENSYFTLSQGRLGVGPAIALGIGLTSVSRKKLLEMVLTGRPITALKAVEAGIINDVVNKNDVESYVEKLVEDLSAIPDSLVRLIKNINSKYMELLDYKTVFRELALYIVNEETRSRIKRFLERKTYSRS